MLRQKPPVIRIDQNYAHNAGLTRSRGIDARNTVALELQVRAATVGIQSLTSSTNMLSPIPTASAIRLTGPISRFVKRVARDVKRPFQSVTHDGFPGMEVLAPAPGPVQAVEA
jgi:hypothetical protein